MELVIGGFDVISFVLTNWYWCMIAVGIPFFFALGEKEEKKEVKGERRIETMSSRLNRESKETDVTEEGEAQAKITVAEAQAKAVKAVSEAAAKYFKGDAQVLKKLEVTQATFAKNTKLIVPNNVPLLNLLDLGDQKKG